jgi:hypothetical protein
MNKKNHLSATKSVKNLSVIFAIIALTPPLFTNHALAQNSLNNNYTIEIRDIDTPSDYEIIAPRKMQTVPDKNAQEKTISSGIESIVQTSPLSFLLSASIIDFGILNPGNPVIRTLNLSVLSESIDFQVIGFQNRQLTGGIIKDILPDTTCDGGNCDETTDAEWNNNLTYGFGYRCENLTTNICNLFTKGNYYKQLSDLSNREIAQTILTGKKQRDLQDAQIIFKMNSSGAQKSESYTNTVTFIAVPNF